MNPSTQNKKYNGKEFVEAHGLDEYDSEARWYYPAVMRTTTLDPLAEKYYSISPYAWCGNNPVNAIDLNGDSVWVSVSSTVINPDGTTSIKKDSYYYGQNASGNYGFLDASGNIYSGTDRFVSDLTTALGNLRNGSVGKALVSDLASSTNNVEIVKHASNKADQNGKYILWNPNSTTGGISESLISNGGNENRPAYIGLGHEMAHVQDIWNGTYDSSTWVTVGGGINIPNAEKYATHIENQLRAENGISIRTHYGIQIDSSGNRVGLESTRIVSKMGRSLFYNQTGKSPSGIPLLPMPFSYK